jgi:hypothetical protein
MSTGIKCGRYVGGDKNAISDAFADKFKTKLGISIAGFVFGSNEAFIHGFVIGYCEKKYTRDCTKSVAEISFNSKSVMDGMVILLSYCGVFGTIVNKNKTHMAYITNRVNTDILIKLNKGYWPRSDSKYSVTWDEITNIEILDDPMEYVYDFTVPVNQTFMVDAGIFVHNTLNTFHSAGIGSLTNTTVGVPRMKEILSVSKNPKTPHMLIYLSKEYRASREIANKIASHIKYTTIGHIKNKIDIYYDNNPNSEDGFMKSDHIGAPFYTRKASRNSCQVDIENLPWLLRIELSREKMIEKEVTLLEIKSKFCNWWERRHLDSKSMKKEERKVLQKITAVAILSNTDNDKKPVIHIRFNVKDTDKIKDPFNTETLNSFIDNIVDTFKLKGLNGIPDIDNIIASIK